MKKTLILAAIPALLLAGNVSAVPVYEAYASYTHTAGTTTTTVDDTAGPATPPPELNAEVSTLNGATTDWSDIARARASVNGLGFGEVEVDGVMYFPEAFDPIANPDQLFSSVKMSESYTNTGMTSESLSYDFFLNPIDLAIGDWAGAADNSPGYGGEPIAEYGMSIVGNGATLWDSAASLQGGVISHSLTESGTDLGGLYYEEQMGRVLGYSFDFYADTLDLGVLDPGETMDLTAELWVSVTTAPFELGGRASLLDPGTVGGWGGELVATAVTPPPPHGVPEPGSLLLIGAGLIGVASAARKNQKVQAG